MTPQRFARTQRLLLLASVLVGLFLMHGVQATPSPMHATGAMVGAAPDDHSVGSDVMSASPQCPGGHCGDTHPGGEICFALLVLAGLILLTAAGSGSRLYGMAGRQLPLMRRGPPRARPPSVYQLSVLRL